MTKKKGKILQFQCACLFSLFHPINHYNDDTDASFTFCETARSFRFPDWQAQKLFRVSFCLV